MCEAILRIAPAFVALAALGTACNEYDITAFESVDVFIQAPTETVDVLLVVDNSGSMQGWQFLVGARFEDFIEYFIEVDTDYHIGVVTTTIDKPTSPFQGCSQADLDAMPEAGHLYQGRYITPETPDAGSVFSELVNVGICGDGFEQGLEAARLALAPEQLSGPNYGFIREEAALSVVFVSDEEDSSYDTVHEYVNDFYDVKDARDREVFNASSLVITDDDDCLVDPGGGSEGQRYVATAELTGGLTANLCNTNFPSTFREFGLNASRLRDTFYLSNTPALASLTVTVGEDGWSCQQGWWSYTTIDELGTPKPVIVFDREHLPEPHERIVVRYNNGSGDPSDFCTAEPEAEAR